MERDPAAALLTNRRTAIGGAAALAAMVGLARQTGHVSAQSSRVDYSDHPLCGMWLVMVNPNLPENPQYASPGLFTADGYMLGVFAITDEGPQGVINQTGFFGTWEPVDTNLGHFTSVQLLSDSNGMQLGSVTVDGYPMVSEDGLAFIDDGTRVMVTIRDAAGAIITVVPPEAPKRAVTGVKMSPGNPGFPEMPAMATPTS